ncbi:hypothetical protein JOC74_002898 [Bacillus capparidis]|uniref:Uncharacterized protein n=1 Tax=Bacillus capparidis TaxID=1840411 RepID=A0ABS4CYF3_9BACI|nr:hypothetical protein [Bacillus capparidis]
MFSAPLANLKYYLKKEKELSHMLNMTAPSLIAYAVTVPPVAL